MFTNRPQKKIIETEFSSSYWILNKEKSKNILELILYLKTYEL